MSKLTLMSLGSVREIQGIAMWPLSFRNATRLVSSRLVRVRSDDGDDGDVVVGSLVAIEFVIVSSLSPFVVNG